MSNIEERSRLEKYAPPGINLAKEVMVFVVSMTCAVIFSLGYVLAYISARNELYEVINDKRILKEGAIIPEFEVILGNYFSGFILVGVAMAIILVYHYAYHYQDSKIIYLMKRLPNRWELHRRCITLPIAGSIVAVVVLILLWAIYFGIYFLFTPQQCLPL